MAEHWYTCGTIGCGLHVGHTGRCVVDFARIEPVRPYTRQQCWALAMREGQLTDGATMDDVRARYAQLLAEHGLAPEPGGGEQP
jgi:hypothetical protein